MSDYHKRYNFLGELFPHQFRSIPSIIAWTVVYMLDVALVIWVAYLLDLPAWLESLMKFSFQAGAHGRLMVIICMILAFGLFCLESFLYNLFKH